jgi:hypothetical protein
METTIILTSLLGVVLATTTTSYATADAGEPARIGSTITAHRFADGR